MYTHLENIFQLRLKLTKNFSLYKRDSKICICNKGKVQLLTVETPVRDSHIKTLVLSLAFLSIRVRLIVIGGVGGGVSLTPMVPFFSQSLSFHPLSPHTHARHALSPFIGCARARVSHPFIRNIRYYASNNYYLSCRSGRSFNISSHYSRCPIYYATTSIAVVINEARAGYENSTCSANKIY